MKEEKIERKLRELEEYIARFEKVAIAFSGGVDSSTLSAVCRKILGDNAIAIFAVSPTTPSREIENAERIADEIGIKLFKLNINELEDSNFVKNPPDRCYYCKKILLNEILKFARKMGVTTIFEGTNYDEIKGHRPGFKAIKELKNVFTPWADLKFTKDEIREIAKRMNLSFYDKPSIACLSSRIPFGMEITLEKLNLVDRAENLIIDIFNVRQVRVRNLDGIAIIEVDKDELHKLLDLEKIRIVVDKLKDLGFNNILLDLEGYSTGKLVRLQKIY